MTTNILFWLFPVELFLLLVLSRITTKELFLFMRRFLSERGTSIVVTILFLPGTIMHELAHFLMAIMLFLRVREVSVLPEFEKNQIKLGRVTYEKRDFVRGILVGIAPIFVGLLIFWFFSIWHLFPSSSFGLSLMVGYLIFVISTTMFSSKQDLVDLIYIIPLAILFVAIIYIFNIDLHWLSRQSFVNALNAFLQNLNIYFLFSFIIHIGLITTLKLLGKVLR